MNSIEKLFLVIVCCLPYVQNECCKYPHSAFQLLLLLKSVDNMSKEDTEQEYSQLVRLLENRTHNVSNKSVSSTLSGYS